MSRDRNSLYLFLGTICLVGYSWVIYNFKTPVEQKAGFDLCLIKRVADVPCPSCGSTRSVVAIFKGDFLRALKLNPIGYILSLLMILTPLWLSYDLILKRDSLVRFYRQVETSFLKKWVAIPAVVLVVINWIWNIYKDI